MKGWRERNLLSSPPPGLTDKGKPGLNRVKVVITVVIAQFGQYVTLWPNVVRVYFEVFFKTFFFKLETEVYVGKVKIDLCIVLQCVQGWRS